MTTLAGLDALTYIQFLRMLRWLFACTSVFVAIPLAVANYYLNTETSYGSTAAGPASQASNTTSGTPTGNLTATAESAATLLDNLQLFTAANITGNGLWVHIGFEWIVSCLVVAFGELETVGAPQAHLNLSGRSFVVSPVYSRGMDQSVSSGSKAGLEALTRV